MRRVVESIRANNAAQTRARIRKRLHRRTPTYYSGVRRSGFEMQVSPRTFAGQESMLRGRDGGATCLDKLILACTVNTRTKQPRILPSAILPTPELGVRAARRTRRQSDWPAERASPRVDHPRGRPLRSLLGTKEQGSAQVARLVDPRQRQSGAPLRLDEVRQPNASVDAWLQHAVRGVASVAVAADRRRKPPIPVESVGQPLALDSLVRLIVQRLAAREQPQLTLVTDEQPRSRVPSKLEG